MGPRRPQDVLRNAIPHVDDKNAALDLPKTIFEAVNDKNAVIVSPLQKRLTMPQKVLCIGSSCEGDKKKKWKVHRKK